MDLVLELDRTDINNPVCTPGWMYLPTGENLCATIERPWNNGDNAEKVSCILPGTYELKYMPSVRWNRAVLHVLNVPGRTFIEIHPANQASELEGCIAPGTIAAQNRVINSKAAVEKVERVCQQAMQDGGRVFLKVSNPK